MVAPTLPHGDPVVGLRGQHHEVGHRVRDQVICGRFLFPLLRIIQQGNVLLPPPPLSAVATAPARLRWLLLTLRVAGARDPSHTAHGWRTAYKVVYRVSGGRDGSYVRDT